MDEKVDLRFPYDEALFISIGEAQGVLLYVAFRLRGEDDDIVHIISARKSFPAERRAHAKASSQFSDEEREALHAMTDREMAGAAKDDPDAREVTPEMLASRARYPRLERSRAKRVAAARALAEEARAEAEGSRKREKTDG